MSWYHEVASGDQKGFVVVEAMLGASGSDDPLPRWKLELLGRLSVLKSNATAEIMQALSERLTVFMEREDCLERRMVEWPWRPDEYKWVVYSASLRFPVDVERAERIRALLAQPIKPYGYTNAYRFVELEEHPDGSGCFWATADLARGEWKEKKNKKGEVVWTHRLSVIEATTGLQRLLASYLMAPSLLVLPRVLRAGVCQETAQQITSTLGQLESPKVRGEVAFPTVEDRDPVRRRAAYEAAIDQLVRDVRPLMYAHARDKAPGKYAADDPRGNRLVVDDERWFAVTRTPEPHPIPLFFVDSGSVRIQIGEARFDAGISKADRHRGHGLASEVVRGSRPEQVQRKGSTGLRAFYALLPVLDSDDVEIIRILAERDARKARSGSRGRGLKLPMRQVPLQAAVTGRLREQDLRLPLSFDRKRFERLLARRDLEIAWAKVVKKGDDWRLQLTLRVPYALPRGFRRVLGVTFGLDAIMTWVLLDENSNMVESGSIIPNPQIAEFLAAKRILEWDQAKGRFVGGRRFARRLEGIAHNVSNAVIELARDHQAVLAIHDIDYVPKSGPDAEANLLFTAWNYGQSRRYCEYKSPLAGFGTPVFTDDFIVRMTCPKCGARRDKTDPVDAPTTWRVKNVLHCRACKYVGTPTAVEYALQAGQHGLKVWRQWWAKEETRGEP